MDKNIYNLINDSRMIILLHNECDLEATLIKDQILKDEVIIINKFDKIAFNDIEVITPSLVGRQLFNKYRNKNYDLYNMFIRNKDTNKLECFKYTLAVLGIGTGSHKYLDIRPKEVVEPSREEIFEILGEL